MSKEILVQGTRTSFFPSMRSRRQASQQDSNRRQQHPLWVRFKKVFGFESQKRQQFIGAHSGQHPRSGNRQGQGSSLQPTAQQHNSGRKETECSANSLHHSDKQSGVSGNGAQRKKMATTAHRKELKSSSAQERVKDKRATTLSKKGLRETARQK
jgi:hypothetical protein